MAGDIRADDNEFDPVARDPSLWELRWTFPDGTRWRMYHAEPDVAPGYLVAMLFHRKSTEGTAEWVKATQNERIDEASNRYVTGRPTMWGLR